MSRTGRAAVLEGYDLTALSIYREVFAEIRQPLLRLQGRPLRRSSSTRDPLRTSLS